MPNIFTMIKRILLLSTIVSFCSLSIVNANTKSITDSSVNSTNSHEPIPLDTTERYGPTGTNETLWSIATRYQPNKSVSIFQVVGAIYHANSDVFENNNIHGLIPGSYLVMPSLEHIQNEKTNVIRSLIEADKLREPYLSQHSVAKVEPKQQARVDVVDKQPEQKDVVTSEALPPATIASSDTQNSGIKPQSINAPEPEATLLEKKEQLELSDEQITKLIEGNEALRLRVSQMQQEMQQLKANMSYSENVRKEVSSFIEQQKQQQEPKPKEVVKETSTWFTQLPEKPLHLAIAIIIPVCLLAILLTFFLLRRKEVLEDEVNALSQKESALDNDIPNPDESHSFDKSPLVPVNSEEKQDENEVLSVDELPEFDEQAALNDPEAEPLEEDLEPPEVMDDDVDAREDIDKKIQAAAEAAMKSHQPVDSESLDVESTQGKDKNNNLSPFDIAKNPDYKFENIDIISLPEFSEEDSLRASFDEQRELEQYEAEQGLKREDEDLDEIKLRNLKQGGIDQSASLYIDAMLSDAVKAADSLVPSQREAANENQNEGIVEQGESLESSQQDSNLSHPDANVNESQNTLDSDAESDADSGDEYENKLDLAKAYLEMNDTLCFNRAIVLLKEIAVRGNINSQNEAKALLAKVE